MKITKSKYSLPAAGIISGLALIGIGKYFQHADIDTLPSAFIGAGAAIFGLSFSKLLYLFMNVVLKRRQPKLQRARKINQNDERNIVIRDKTGAKTNNLTLDLLFVITFVFTFLGANLYVIAAMAGVMLVNIVAYAVYADYYDKRL